MLLRLWLQKFRNLSLFFNITILYAYFIYFYCEALYDVSFSSLDYELSDVLFLAWSPTPVHKSQMFGHLDMVTEKTGISYSAGLQTEPTDRSWLAGSYAAFK